MSRIVTLGHWYGEDPEHYAELELEVTEPERETYWHPGHPGYIEECRLWIDGEEVPLRDHAELVERIKDRERIPEPEERW